jgi:hypothetical protein
MPAIPAADDQHICKVSSRAKAVYGDAGFGKYLNDLVPV